MQSLINKLFNSGTKLKYEKELDPALYERNAKLDEAEKRETELLTLLNEEQKLLFNKWRNCEEELWCNEFELAYEQGFKTGALLILEVHNIKI